MDKLAVLLVAWCLTREVMSGLTGCVICSTVCPTREMLGEQIGCVTCSTVCLTREMMSGRRER